MDTKKHSHLPVFIVLSLVFIGLIITATYLTYRQKNFDSVIKVGLKSEHSAQFAGMYVAESKEYYKDEGINIEFVEANSQNKNGIDSVLNGQNDFAIVSPLELVDYVAKDKPIKAIAAIYQESPTVIVSLPETGIKEPRDLKNKVLGTSKAENYSFTLYKFLVNKYKIPANSLDYKNIDNNALDQLLSRKVDAVSMYRTQIYLPEGYPEQNFSIIKPEDYDIHMYNDIIVTSNKLIEDNPKLVQNFLNATIKGWNDALDYKDEAVDATMKYTEGRQHDAALQKKSLESSAELIRPEGIRTIGQMKASRWLEIYHLYKSTVLSQEFDVSKGYTIDFLP